MISNETKDLFDIYDLALEENNSEIIKETTINIKSIFTKVKQIEIICFLSN